MIAPLKCLRLISVPNVLYRRFFEAKTNLTMVSFSRIIMISNMRNKTKIVSRKFQFDEIKLHHEYMISDRIFRCMLRTENVAQLQSHG